MDKEPGKMDGSFNWAANCGNGRIVLISNSGDKWTVPRGWTKEICKLIELAGKKPTEYFLSNPSELQLFFKEQRINLKTLKEVKIVTNNYELDEKLRGMVDESVRKYMKEKDL